MSNFVLFHVRTIIMIFLNMSSWFNHAVPHPYNLNFSITNVFPHEIGVVNF